MNDINQKKWYVYMVRCEDNSLYTGITTDVARRFEEHKSGKGAKYTKNRKPLKIEIIFQTNNRSEASKLEYFIKNFSKKEKENKILDEKNKKFFIIEAENRLNIKINL